MVKDESVTYGRLPYWNHNLHTATCVERIDFPDGTADLTMLCECGIQWHCAEGVDHSDDEEPGCREIREVREISSGDVLTSDESDG